jgi:hypothetical protein
MATTSVGGESPYGCEGLANALRLAEAGMPVRQLGRPFLIGDGARSSTGHGLIRSVHMSPHVPSS